jgi:hypothetical protein
MEITAQHAKCERVGAREEMIKRFFFGGIALKCANITPGNMKFSLRVKTDLTYPPPALTD